MIPRTLLLALLSLAMPAAAGGQAAAARGERTVVVADPGDALRAARAAQDLFERSRVRYLPITYASLGGSCDEYVGRFCTRYDEGEWYPIPEREEIQELRSELVARLDSLQRLAPADGWILAQRVWYRSEGGDWGGALVASRGCGSVRAWWCVALEGFALHGLGRYRQSSEMFDRALVRMDPDLAREWRIPELSLDSDGRDVIADLEEASEDSLDVVLTRLWQLADPLYLVEGNDRLTAHYARRVVATLRDRARNPFHLVWGSDLAELTIRHGWEVGWERSPAFGVLGPDDVIGHTHPEGRDYMPPGKALLDPGAATFDDLVADRRRPRSLYAPRYAPVLLPMKGQLAVFPRGDRMVVVATHFLPEDTTFHAGHRHERQWMAPGEQAGMADRIGLFALPVDGGRVPEQRMDATAEGALMLEVPTGSYVVSAESWSPERRRAGRLRTGIKREAAPADVATLSDLLLLAPGDEEPRSLAYALSSALPRAEILPGQTFAIVWEVSGLGFRPETFQFEVSVEKTDRGVLRRIGEFLGIAERPQPLALSWEEPGPDQPIHHFRYLHLDVPYMDPGDYRVRLVLRTAGRTDAVTTQTFTVRER